MILFLKKYRNLILEVVALNVNKGTLWIMDFANH